MIDRSMSLVEIAFLISTALERASITAVLTGGTAAAYYAPQEYQSDDADFVVVLATSHDIDAPMKELGFKRQGRMFAHPHSRYTVEFPSGPLAVGTDIVRKWERIERGNVSLNVISRTDSVRDRLCGFYFWNELRSMRAALAVARAGRIDLDLIRDWSERQDEMEKFAQFEKELKIGARRRRRTL